ncbi:ATP-binding protein [Prevotella sp.]|uniref:ATP-binding protein n=1 Tax=Prevotella sp. TaxID=59823 RepID=UPI00307F1B41
MRYFPFTIIAVILAFVCSTHAIKAQPTAANNEDSKQKSLYVLANKNIGNEKSLVLADSLIKAAKKKGDTETVLRGLYIKLKHEYQKDNNIQKVDRAVNSIIDFAKKHNLTKHIYSAASYKMTYLTNHGKYNEAIKYQYYIMDYAKRHKHNNGIVLGHISMGNLFRKRLKIPQAIEEYEQAIESYRKYGIDEDQGRNYIRIIECYIIIGMFEKALDYSSKGLELTKRKEDISGIYGYMAFCSFMLNNKADFKKEYKAYKSYSSSSTPNIIPFVANCIETMKLIDDGKFNEAEKKLKAPGMGAFKQYVEISLYNSQERYEDLQQAMRRLHINRFGDSKGSFTTDWARMSEAINNNLTEIDKQRAINRSSQLELTKTRLELKNTQLELFRFKDAEKLAWMASDAKKLTYNNERLLSEQLAKTLENQNLQHKINEQKIKSKRITLAFTSLLLLLMYLYLRYNKRAASILKEKNMNLKKTLEELSIANDKAQESDKKKTEFIQNMSHEVRTPLNAIVGFSQMLATESDTNLSEEDRKQISQIINTNSEILNTIITNILDLTSIENGRYTIKENVVNINDLCKSAIESVKHRKAEDVEMIFKTDIPDNYAITTDKTRVLQVITNLLSNAVKNTEHGSITLGCSLNEQSGMVMFSVTDTGIGIKKEQQEKIFERFYKIDHFKPGTGLGLNICKAIAEKLNGSVGIDSSYTNGARFYFSIPNDTSFL